ncbi:uncharacterized protein LOC107001206 [Solanum pennellii]|uniref:Uncharacterized protein LOC107001206 n=1 Tax=Solanum pennellii TaxID=28526 RepID=A0ABM1FCD3_SOLPN|nr:uncharacterized protein LOC107001206 [Solanum pennellii]
MQSFVDCYAGYHQILMDEEDAEKTAFTTPCGVYHYRVMPFGLKNVGATYMRAMTTIFHDMIHKEIEVYVDDVIIKSCESSDHLTHLRKFFDRLRRYNLKLNPVKCAFGVPVEKLLGFIISRRDSAFGCVLGQHDETGKKERAIYYISKKFTPYESRYTLLERMCCALTWLAQKLRHYLSSYTIYLISRVDPLKYIFQKVMPTGKLAKWQMLLSGFDIVYVTQKAIKAQSLVDHLAENPVDEEDSDLLIHHVQGEWVVKNPKIIPYVQYVQKLCKRFRKIEFRHTPRIQNEFADALATIASMMKHPDTYYIDPLDIDVKEHLVHCSHVEVEPDGLPWYFDIKKYLESGTYPEDATSNQKKLIRRMALNFFLIGEVLYRRTLDLGFLRCVDAIEAAKLIEQIHAGVCGMNMNELTLVHADLIRVPPHELYAMSSPWPFVAWGMDVIGSIEPATSNGHGFILVAIGYFTNHLMRYICEQFKITHRNSTAYHPQMNRAVEAANRNIKNVLRKMIDKHRSWHEMSPYALLGYRTTVRTSIGAAPYLLMYGTEAVIPAEVEIPSLRIIQEAELSNVERVSKRIDQLTLINEKRMIAICHDEYKGKFAPNWQGPYMVRKVLSGGALVLSEMDGTTWPKPINSDAVKRYYV